MKSLAVKSLMQVFVFLFVLALTVSGAWAILSGSNHVVIPAATGNGNITLDTSNCGIFNVSTMTEAGVGNDPSFDYPYGLVAFSVGCNDPDVTITFPGSISGTTYRKYGPTTPGNDAVVYLH